MYEILHYPGDVTDAAVEGKLLGEDELGRPYEIIDSEFDGERTTVHLKYASKETLKANSYGE